MVSKSISLAFIFLILLNNNISDAEFVVNLKYYHDRQAQQASNSDDCPPWSELTANGTCECTKMAKHEAGNRHKIKLWCFNNITSLPYCYCLSYNEKFNTTVEGFCRTRCNILGHDPARKKFTGFHRYEVIVRSNNMTEFNDNACSSLQMNRTGQMCEGICSSCLLLQLGLCQLYRLQVQLDKVHRCCLSSTDSLLCNSHNVSNISSVRCNEWVYFDKPGSSITCCDGILSIKLRISNECMVQNFDHVLWNMESGLLSCSVHSVLLASKHDSCSDSSP